MSRCMLAIGLLLTSCAAWDPPGDVAAPVAAYVAAPAGIAASAPAADANQLAPRGELTTQDALAWAWYNHPKMKRAQRMIGEARGGRVQAGLWPNPTVGAGYVEEKNYKKGAQFSLAQKFEMGGKLSARIAEADAAIAVTESELMETWNDIRAAIKESHVRLAFAQSRLKLETALAELDAEQARLIEGLWKNGKAQESDYLEAAQAGGKSLAAARSSEAMVADAHRQALAAMGMIPVGKNLPSVAGSMTMPSSPQEEDFATLVDKAGKASPALATAKLKIAVAKAQRRLAMTKRWSDVTLEMDYRPLKYDDGSTGWEMMAGASFDLPVWNQYQGDVAAAGQKLGAQEQAAELARIDLAAQLSDLVATRQRWQVTASTYARQVLPPAERQLKLAEELQAKGKMSRLEYLKVARNALMVEMEQLQSLLLAGVATVQLERVAGAAQ